MVSAAAVAAPNGGSTPRPHYEWMGPPGALSLMLSLPVVLYLLYSACNEAGCLTLDPKSQDFLFFEAPSRLVSVRGSVVWLSWLLLHYVLYLLVPGPLVQGAVLDAQGRRLSYRCNGALSAVLSVAIVCSLVWLRIIPATLAYDEFVPLMSAGLLSSLCLSAYLYWASFTSDGRYDTPDTQLAFHGQTGNAVYDFFVGRQLNPRLLGVDLKFVCELRPGMLAWLLFDLSFAAAQQQRHGSVTASMWLVVCFQCVYVIDALVSESSILSTMDITTDGFGFMLAFGDLAWVPFVYSLQPRLLVSQPQQLSWPAIAAIVLLELLGLFIFRQSNNEKDAFRTQPSHAFTRTARFLQTASGSRLLLSGWWGRSRHPNYLGDLLMSLSWSLPCGLRHPLAFFYPLYFLVVLLHRQRRDDDKCSRKYGKDWDTYCSLVPYRIVPNLY